ncbi:hypothetical protein VNI00_016751 [Paramarasmius palmivorus]|uniref:Uncharacterized protein n=1 Tax=Paramarasmius palmivorus TaxID=297713 RepID=A0AAW0BD32_9AGAR
MVYHCVMGIKAWSPVEEDSALLHKIYQRQSLSPVTCRWRAITKMYSKFAFAEIVKERIQASILRSITDIAHAAGVRPIKQGFQSNVQADIIWLVTKAVEIDRVLSTEMTSEEFTVFVAPLGEAFDQGRMETVYREDTGWVLCTTDMGLCCRAANGEGTSVYQIVLKPKVVLDQAFI